MSCEQHVLHRAAGGYQPFIRVNRVLRGVESGDRQHEKRAAESLFACLLFLFVGCFSVALDEGLGKGLSQKVPPLLRNNDQAPGSQESVVGRRPCGSKYFFDLFPVRPRIAKPLGGDVLARMNQLQRRIDHILVFNWIHSSNITTLPTRCEWCGAGSRYDIAAHCTEHLSSLSARRPRISLLCHHPLPS